MTTEKNIKWVFSVTGTYSSFFKKNIYKCLIVEWSSLDIWITGMCNCVIFKILFAINRK